MIGVLMLDTRFPRPVGDIGNPESFQHPVCHEVVRGANVSAVVRAEGPGPQILQSVLAHCRRLLRQADLELITTSCGFLFPLQNSIQSQLPLQFLSSALLLVELIRSNLKITPSMGIMTFDSESLQGPAYRQFAIKEVQIAGLEQDCHLRQVISNDIPALDTGLASEDVCRCAEKVCSGSQPVDLIIMECTNFPPYRHEVSALLDKPVFDLFDLIQFHLDPQTSRIGEFLKAG